MPLTARSPTGALLVLLCIGFIAYAVYVMVAPFDSGHAPTPPGLQQRAAECNDLYNQGRQYLRHGELHMAEASLRKAMPLDPTLRPLLCAVLAETLAEEGKTTEALTVYAEAYNAKTLYDSTFPEHLEGLLRYALLCIHTGHWAQAVQVEGWAVQYMALPPGSPLQSEVFSATVPCPMDMDAMIHVMQAIELNKRGKTYEALTALQQALSLAPNSAVVRYYQGLTLRQRGQRAEAQAAFQKAADLGSGDVKTAAEAALKGR